MDGQDLLNGLEFHHDCILHEQINPVIAVQLESFVAEGQMDLTSKGKTHLAQFIADTFLICRFKQPRAQLPIYINRGRNNPVSDPVEVTESLCFLRSLCVLRFWVALHFSSLRLSPRLCVSAVNPHLPTPSEPASTPVSFSKCRLVSNDPTPHGSSAKFCALIPGCTAPGRPRRSRGIGPSSRLWLWPPVPETAPRARCRRSSRTSSRSPESFRRWRASRGPFPPRSAIRWRRWAPCGPTAGSPRSPWHWSPGRPCRPWSPWSNRPPSAPRPPRGNPAPY